MRGSLAMSHVTILKTIGVMWTEGNSKPEGLSALAVSPSRSKSSEDTRRQLSLQVRAETKSSLDQADVDYVIGTAELHLPANIHELQIILKTYGCLWELFSGEGSLIHTYVKQWAAHCEKFYQNYESQFKGNAIFGAQVLFAMDVGIQTYLLELNDTDTPWDRLDHDYLNQYRNRRHDAITTRQLQVALPDNFLKVIPKADPSSGHQAPKRPSQEGFESPAPKKNKKQQNASPQAASNTEPIKNLSPHASWILPAGGKPYKELFSPQLIRNLSTPIPKVGSTNICLKFHASGQCGRKDCSFDHSQVAQIDEPTKAIITEFFSQVYQS